MLRALTTAIAAMAVLISGAISAQANDQQVLIDQSKATMESLAGQSDLEGMRILLKQAKGVLIVPQLLKAGFIIGGEGGSGVLLARQADGSWSAPAFYTLGAASLGLQIGAEAKEVVLLIMNTEALNAVINNQVKLGADASVAVGPVGKNVEAATTTNLNADIYSYARAKGLFGGVSVEGAVIAARDKWNQAYYGQAVTTGDIVARGKVDAEGTKALRMTVRNSEL
ncbi:lipid-binding SYLF domain-containing protein [Oceanibacterium hippocampi]|uniref:Ysc84 actin-binding domain-containing protein n=1 Tax=Oceanibacterium hippocampi TaxID=745714 RepID=A0A1Y5RN15_9PROT|nr:lipid-binding SYLF domain-containing protein [Oceanibacterium hippocampi]SLN21315.1 hypothetical protein OCH7691_00539 [Oceanibacterium hippocampi]